MEFGYNVRIIMNDDIFYLSSQKEIFVEEVLFDNFIEKSQVYYIDDDGNKYKNQLKKFDIGVDKDLGGFWNFKVNDESIHLIKKVMKFYSTGGHMVWKLKGDGFIIEYEDLGDTHSYQEFINDGPSGKFTVGAMIIIKTDEKNLSKFNEILKSYKSTNKVPLNQDIIHKLHLSNSILKRQI